MRAATTARPSPLLRPLLVAAGASLATLLALGCSPSNNAASDTSAGVAPASAAAQSAGTTSDTMAARRDSMAGAVNESGRTTQPVTPAGGSGTSGSTTP